MKKPLEWWKRQISWFRHLPNKSFLFPAALVIVGLVFRGVEFYEEEADRQQNLNYHKQMESLSHTEQNLKELMTFVEHQKQKLRESQDVLSDLRNEEEQLRPIVETEREVVDAIFQMQAKRNRATIWKDRALAFLFGVTASTLAAFFYGLINRRIREDIPPSSRMLR